MSASALNMRDVRALIGQMPSLLDQDYDGLCEEIHVGNGARVTAAARRVYYLHCMGDRSSLGDDRKTLDRRLQQAAYAVNALLECHESGDYTVDATTVRRARELFDRMAEQLGTTTPVLQRACI